MAKLYQLIFIWLMLCCSLGFSQNSGKTDSLVRLLDNEKLSQKERASLLRKISYFHPNLHEALLYARQSLGLAEALNDRILQAEAFEEISHLERQLGNNSASFEAAFKALRIYESENLSKRQAASYNQIATNYMADKNYSSAISYLKKAGNLYSTDTNHQNHALTILNLGEAYRLFGYLDSAATAFQKALKLNNTLKSDIVQGYSLGNLGMVYNAQNKLMLAKGNLNTAIHILGTLEDNYSTSVYTAELGTVYRKEGKYKEAEDKFLEALGMAKQAGLKEQIRDFSTQLSNFYEKQEQYASALEYQKLFQVYQDSLVNKDNVQRIEQLKAGYEIDKRESEIGLLNDVNTKQKYWVATLGTGLALLIFFAYLLYKGKEKLSKQKDIITKREEEKAMLLRELNHRIKNNLQMISSLLNLQSHELTGHPAKEVIIAGKHRVEALSLVHRKLYQENTDTRIMLKDYIEELVLGLFHGYGTSFKPQFKIDDISVSLDTAVPLALVINEIIINALKYAYQAIKSPKLKLIMTANKSQLDIQVIDNGIGFNTSEAEKNNAFGIKLIYSLIDQLDGVIKKLDSKTGTHWKMNIKLT